ncbi:MAG: 3-keto-disaccharide hydrolase [Novosphingobium sp.]|uniref:3-keto-disaccharide hydrolase n=1 Tax=Novosphingobium sp. TaxID=1874826 RepID=UPI003B9BCDF4
MPSRRIMLQSLAALTVAANLPRPARASAPSSPWRALFNGRNLDGWTIYQDGEGNIDRHGAIRIEKGVLHMLGSSFTGPDKASFGHLATKTLHGNYHLRMDFRFGERRFAPRVWQRRNSGLLYHMGPELDRLFPDCVEFQFEEGDIGDAIMVNTKALQGPLLGGTPLWPTYFPGLPRTYADPVNAGGIARQWHRHASDYERIDGWNTIDLIAFEDQAAHLVNGRIVNTLFNMIDRNQQPLKTGRIALEFEAAEVFLRNVMIRDLSAEDIALIRKQGSY